MNYVPAHLCNGVPSRSLLVPCFPPILVISLIFLTLPVSFATNDDGMSQLVMAGVIAPEPAGYVPFMGLVVPWFVSRLFCVAPHVAWWPILHLMTIWASLSYINIACDRWMAAKTYQRSPITRMVALAVADLCIASPFIVRLQFTTTATLAASSALFGALVLNGEVCKGSSGRGLSVAAPVALSVISAGYRLQCAQLGVFFWVLAMAIQITVDRGKPFAERLLSQKHRLFVCGAALISVLAVTAGCRVYFSSTEAWQSSWDLAVAQSTYTDFPSTQYEDDPELYEGVDWDVDLTQLSKLWFQMDERQTTEAYSAINAENDQAIRELVNSPLQTINGRLYSVRTWVPVTYLCIAATVVAISCVLISSRERQLGLAVSVGACTVLAAYLVFKGRVNDRALYSVVIPFMFSVLAMALLGEEALQESKGKFRPLSILLLVLETFFIVYLLMIARGNFARAVCVFTLILVVGCLACLKGRKDGVRYIVALAAILLLCLVPSCVKQYGWTSEDYLDLRDRKESTSALFDLCEANPDSFYIYDLAGYFIPTDLWSLRWPPNQTNWGGWKNTYFWYEDALQRDGYQGIPSSRDFLRENVRYVCGYDANAELLLRYLQGRYGEKIEMVKEQSLGDRMVVYRFEEQ